MPRDLPMQTGQGPVLSSQAQFISQETSRPLLWPSSISSVTPLHAVNSDTFIQSNRPGYGLLLLAHHKLSASPAKCPPKHGLHRGAEQDSESQRTQTQLPSSKASLQLRFQAQESSEMPLGPPGPLPWRLGSTAPAHSPLGPGGGARGVLAPARLFPSSSPGFSLARSTSATDPASPVP